MKKLWIGGFVLGLVLIQSLSWAEDKNKSLLAGERKGPERGVLLGTVTDASGKALSATISFEDPKTPVLKADSKTGKYRVELAPDKYKIKVEAAGYEPADQKVKVKAGEETAADFQLKLLAPVASEKGILLGTVTDASGKALSATISFEDSRIPVLKADPKTGGYRGEVPTGKHKITVQADGYEPQEEKVKVQVGTEAQAKFRLELRKGANLPNKPKETNNPMEISSYSVSQTAVIKELKSRPQVDAEIKKLMIEIGNLGQDLTKLETDVYLLREKVLEGKSVGAIAQLVLVNNLNRIFDVKKVQVKIDDQVVFDQEDQEDKFDTQKENELYRGAISPGSHQVTTLVSIQGRGWGLFGYFQKYNFELRSSRMFYFSEGQVSILKLNCVDRGGRFELKDRLRLDFELVGQEPSQK